MNITHLQLQLFQHLVDCSSKGVSDGINHRGVVGISRLSREYIQAAALAILQRHKGKKYSLMCT